MTLQILALRTCILTSRTAMLLATLTVFLVVADTVAAKKGGKPGSGPAYTLIRLAPPGVAITASLARDLDQAGNVVGFYDSQGQSFGFYYDLNQDDWLLFGAGIKVAGLNNFGEMVGFDQNTGEGLYWSSPDEDPVTLSPLAGDQGMDALRINDDGIILGQSVGPEGVTAVVWAVDDAGVVSAPLVLPRPTGDTSASLHQLNEAEAGITQIVGGSGSDYPGDTAIRWEVKAVDGVPSVVSDPSDLGSLGGAPSVAYGINFFGDIVGQSGNWPFLKTAGQPMQPLAGIRKATNGSALDINDAGVIVGDQGYLFHGQAIQKAVLWTAAGNVQELNKKVNLGASETLKAAGGINDAGQIIGLGFFPGITDAGDVGFLLVPTQ